MGQGKFRKIWKDTVITPLAVVAVSIHKSLIWHQHYCLCKSGQDRVARTGGRKEEGGQNEFSYSVFTTLVMQTLHISGNDWPQIFLVPCLAKEIHNCLPPWSYDQPKLLPHQPRLQGGPLDAPAGYGCLSSLGLFNQQYDLVIYFEGNKQENSMYEIWVMSDF